MASVEQRRRIERWRNEVADLATGVGDVCLTEPAAPVAVQTAPTTYTPISEPKLTPAALHTNPYAPVVNTVRRTSTRRTPPTQSPAATRKSEPQIVRVIVQPSSSDDSASRHRRRRSSRTEKSYPPVSAATTRSRPTANYATSREDSDRRSRRSPPLTYTRSIRSRRSPSPQPKYSVIRRVLRLPEKESRRKYYDDDYDYERPRRPTKPPRPRTMSVDGRQRAYYSRSSPYDDERSIRNSRQGPPHLYGRPDGDHLARSGTVRSSYGVPRRRDDWDEDRRTVPDRFTRLHDQVDRMRLGAKKFSSVEDDRVWRRRPLYDDYDHGGRRSPR